MRLATRDGLSLAYRVVGEGPPLVCQPGGPGRASRYLQDLGGLDRTRTLVVLDAIGTGDSERPADAARLRSAALADDLDDLRAHLGYDAMDLLGHSAGAVVAQRYAAARPHRVRRLVLVTPSGRLQGVSGQDVSRRDTYGAWTDAAAAHAAHVDEEMDRTAEREFGAEPDPAVVAALRDVTAPVLVVAGGADRLTPPAAAEAVAASFPNAVLRVLDGVGHYPWVEAPAAFAGIVAVFLGEGDP